LHECLEQPVLRGQSVVLATVVGPNDLSNSSLRLGARLLLTAKGNSNGYLGNAELQKAVEHDAEKILGSDQISAHTYPCGKIGVEVLIEGLTPEKRLILFGAGEDALPIVRIASEVGFDITVIDQRRAYADALRLPGADAVLHTEDVLSTIQQINPDPKTAFVSVTHNYLLDIEIMRNLAPTQTIYVGVVGPRARADQLIAASGWPDAEQHRLYCPAGLDIGAKTPEGIALSVVAEVQAVLAARLGSHLRERSGPIHGPTT
jgi:xanthine/CO dehydrogenase XdhC/CoxF family maturation factor